jgi:hypothetical protein
MGKKGTICGPNTISKLSTFVCWITSKEIHMASIPWWHQEIAEIVCMFEKELPSFMDLQVHLLIHLVDEVELVGVVSLSLDVFFREVHEEIERICSSKGKT